ncbi:MAG: hypothetical protein AAFV86_11195 [Pseudomonadota bacterium]
MTPTAILRALADIARRATDEDLRLIAINERHGNGRQTWEAHIPALREVIFERGCRMDEDKHNWFPLEAVELTSHHMHAGEEKPFAIATALLLIHCLEEDDPLDFFAFRWPRCHAFYVSLPQDFRCPILAALAWLEARGALDREVHTKPLLTDVPSARTLFAEHCA